MGHRAAWNTTMDIYYGPTSIVGPPGVQYAAAVPCRVVPQIYISQIEFPESLTGWWVTYPEPQLNMAPSARIDGQKYSRDYGGADVLAIPTGTDPVWMVLRAERIAPLVGDAYRRVLICRAAEVPVPPPPPPPPPPPGFCDAYLVNGEILLTDNGAGAWVSEDGDWGMFPDAEDPPANFQVVQEAGEDTNLWQTDGLWDGHGCVTMSIVFGPGAPTIEVCCADV